jgi:hypothetical protein
MFIQPSSKYVITLIIYLPFQLHSKQNYLNIVKAAGL